MSRQNEYRAWDKEQKCMLSWDQLMDIRYNHNWFRDNIDKNYINCIFFDHDLELLQFTGLWDKNGIKIFESDIVKNNILKWEVVFNKGAFVGVPIDEYDYNLELMTFCNISCIKGIEVIGNIYEDNHLIA